MLVAKTMCYSLVFALLTIMGGCGATSQESEQPVAGIKTNSGKQEVASLIARSKNIDGYSYQYTIDINGDKKTGKAWASREKRRSETVIDGKKVITIYDAREQIVYSYYPDEKQAVKMPAEDTPDLVASPEDYLQGILNDRITLLGDTSYQQFKCRLITAQDPQSQAHIKLWVKTDWGIPLRVESTDPDGNSCVVEYDDVMAAAQPKNLFKLPAGTNVVDLVQLMQGQPNP